jgi:hypothetical protein
VTTPTGPLAEEAARLVEALAEWTRDHVGPQVVATGSAECALCPFCQLIGVLRHTQPETFGHLVDASTSLTLALHSVIDGYGRRASGPTGIQRIDLDEDVAP